MRKTDFKLKFRLFNCEEELSIIKISESECVNNDVENIDLNLFEILQGEMIENRLLFLIAGSINELFLHVMGAEVT